MRNSLEVFEPSPARGQPAQVSNLLRTAIQCFFNVDQLPEWSLRGFSIDCYTVNGGGPSVYAQSQIHLHVKRHSSFYLWKIVLPLLLSSFSSFFFDLDNLSDRNATSLTMFLATAALLFVGQFNNSSEASLETTPDTVMLFL